MYFAWYNFVRVHSTLKTTRQWLQELRIEYGRCGPSGIGFKRTPDLQSGKLLFRRTSVNIKRVTLLVIVAITFFSVGIYSQTKFYSDATLVPHTTYSGDNLGFTVTSASNGKI